jgi:hypothetical protein
MKNSLISAILDLIIAVCMLILAIKIGLSTIFTGLCITSVVLSIFIIITELVEKFNEK